MKLKWHWAHKPHLFNKNTNVSIFAIWLLNCYPLCKQGFVLHWCSKYPCNIQHLSHVQKCVCLGTAHWSYSGSFTLSSTTFICGWLHFSLMINGWNVKLAMIELTYRVCVCVRACVRARARVCVWERQFCIETIRHQIFCHIVLSKMRPIVIVIV